MVPAYEFAGSIRPKPSPASERPRLVAGGISAQGARKQGVRESARDGEEKRQHHGDRECCESVRDRATRAFDEPSDSSIPGLAICATSSENIDAGKMPTAPQLEVGGRLDDVRTDEGDVFRGWRSQKRSWSWCVS